MQAQEYETIAIGEHLWSQALQTRSYLRRTVADDELALPERARKASGFGYPIKQTRPT